MHNVIIFVSGRISISVAVMGMFTTWLSLYIHVIGTPTLMLVSISAGEVDDSCVDFHSKYVHEEIFFMIVLYTTNTKILNASSSELV